MNWISATLVALFTMLAFGTGCKVKRDNQKLARPIGSSARIEVENSAVEDQATPLTLHIFTGEQGLGFTEESNTKQTHSFGSKEEGWSDGTKQAAIVTGILAATTAAVVGWRRAGRSTKMAKLNNEVNAGLAKQKATADSAFNKLKTQAADGEDLDSNALRDLGVKPADKGKLQKFLKTEAEFSHNDGLIIAESTRADGVKLQHLFEVDTGLETKIYVHHKEVPSSLKDLEPGNIVIFPKKEGTEITEGLEELDSTELSRFKNVLNSSSEVEIRRVKSSDSSEA